MRREGRRKFGKVTRDGRLVVNVDQLYRSLRVQNAMRILDCKIEDKKGDIPNSTQAFARPLNQ